MKNFELALSELIDSYRRKITVQSVIDALNAQAGLLVGDNRWTDPVPPPEPGYDIPDEEVEEVTDTPMGEGEATAPTQA